MPNWTIIVGIVVIVYFAIEESAATRWSQWAFHGIRVFRRVANYGTTRMTVHEIVDFILTDSEIKSTGFILKKVGDSRFLIRVQGLSPRIRLAGERGTFWIGELLFDSDRGVMKLTFSVMRGLFAFLMLPVIGAVWLALADGEYLAAIGVPLFFATVYVFAFLKLIKPSIEDFWFLLTTKLRVP